MNLRPPRRVWELTLVVACTAVLLQVFGVRLVAQDWHGESSLPALLATAAAFAIAEMLQVHFRFGRDTYSFTLTEIPLIVGLFWLDPNLLILAKVAGGAAALVVHDRQFTNARKLVFNVVLFALSTQVAILSWWLILHGHSPFGPWGWLAVAAVVLICGVIGGVLIGVAMRLESGTWSRELTGVVATNLVTDLINAVFALLIVYIVATDWRAIWVVAVFTAVLAMCYRSYTRLRQHSERLELLNRFIRAMGEQLDVNTIANVVLAHVSEALGSEQTYLTLDDRFEAETAASWALVRGDTGSMVVDSDEPFLTWVRESVGEGLLLPKAGRDRRARQSAGGTSVKDLVAVPLRCDGMTVGALMVVDRMGDVGTFTRDDLNELGMLAGHASVALENARLADLLRQQVAEQEHQAMHDELTGLPNRRMFRQELTLALRRSDTLAVLLLDLDRFKEINDTLGHQVGDEMLCVAASRLVNSAPPGSVVARFGGDEFGVLLRNTDEHSALTAAQWMRHALARPYELGGLVFVVDVSIGVASSRGAPDADALVRHADVAMYTAKNKSTGVMSYRADLDRNSPERLTLLADLRQALATGSLSLVFQPKADLRDGSVHGAEALIRWNHPKLGFVPPDEFIPIAEHSGLITPLTLWVLRHALTQREQWRTEGHDLGVAVNISPRSLIDPGFVDEVARLLDGLDAPADSLTLEITENSIMDDPERAIPALQRLRNIGVSLSVDDLGTGQSSLSYLLRLPVNEVKIDRSFLHRMAEDTDARAIVSAVVELGHRLGRQVVAEGVEDEATWEQLRSIGCDVAQGYWLSRPIPGDRMTAWLAGWTARVKPLRAVQ